MIGQYCVPDLIMKINNQRLCDYFSVGNFARAKEF